MSLPRRRWIDMTTEELSSAGAAVASWIAVLPVAAVEQHGPHLPLGVDGFIGEGCLARGMALVPDATPITVLPTQWIGASAEHEDFSGTLSLSAETYLRVLIEIGLSIARAGVRKLVFVNSHGGNSPMLDVAARELRARARILAVTTSWRRFGHPDGLFSADEVRHDIHAGKIETSLMRALHPDLVRMEHAENFEPATVAMERDYAQLRASSPAGFGWMAQDLHASGAVGDAAAATAEAGEASIEHVARAFAGLIDDVSRFPLDRLRDGPSSGA